MRGVNTMNNTPVTNERQVQKYLKREMHVYWQIIKKGFPPWRLLRAKLFVDHISLLIATDIVVETPEILPKLEEIISLRLQRKCAIKRRIIKTRWHNYKYIIRLDIHRLSLDGIGEWRP